MLQVSDSIALARGEQSAAALGRRQAQRFEVGAAPVVVWNVCRHCNMSCPHCYAAASSAPSNQDLSTAEALRVVGDLAAAGVRVLILSGGEPLLRGDLFELLDAAAARGIATHLSSNGVLIDAAMAARLAQAKVAYVGVSIDGTAQWNDGYRGFQHGFERALAGLDLARDHGMKTGLRMTLTRRNAAMLMELLELARAHAFDRFYLSHLVYAGRGLRLSSDDLTPARTRGVLEALFDAADQLVGAAERLRIVTGGNDSAGPLLLRFIAERYGELATARVEQLLRSRGGNSAGDKLLNIDHRGEVHPDQFWRQARLGNVREQSFKEILGHPLLRELRARENLLEGRCAACRYGQLCRGSHRARALAATGRMWGSDPACVMANSEIRWPCGDASWTA